MSECQELPDDGNVRRNAAGNPVKSVAHTLSGVRSILRSLPRRVELFEVNETDLAALNALHTDIEQALADCVRRMRAHRDWRGRPTTSWADIGRALGMTRQSAQERFR